MKKNIFILKIFFNHILSKLRLNILIFFVKSNKLTKNNLVEFKKIGITKITNYLNSNEVAEVLQECENELNNLPNNIPDKIYIENQVLGNGIRIEKMEGSIKIKNLQLINKKLKELTRNKVIFFFSAFYSYGIFKILKFISIFRTGVTLIYNLTHDGSYKHNAVPGASKGNVIAGMAHFDSPKVNVKGFIALKKIDKQNGPFVCYENSNQFDFLTKYNLDYFYKLHNSKTTSQSELSLIEKKAEEECKIKFKKYVACLNPGDLVLFDTRNVHYASVLEEGQRQILWLYF
jgi:hypothetical protein